MGKRLQAGHCTGWRHKKLCKKMQARRERQAARRNPEAAPAYGKFIGYVD